MKRLLILIVALMASSAQTPIWSTNKLAWTMEKMTAVDAAMSGSYRLYVDNVIVGGPVQEIPPMPSITDINGAIWTLKGDVILRDGKEVLAGRGSQLLYTEGQLYTLGNDNDWWAFRTTWVQVGPTKPHTGRALPGVLCTAAGVNAECTAPLVPLPPGKHALTLTFLLGNQESKESLVVAVVTTGPTSVTVK